MSMATHYDPNSQNEVAIPLPSSRPTVVLPHIFLQPPLSRRGHGPGLIVIIPPPTIYAKLHLAGQEPLDPTPSVKWAEEGFAIATIIPPTTFNADFDLKQALTDALTALNSRADVDFKDKVGVLIYEPGIVNQVINFLPSFPTVVCLVVHSAAAPSVVPETIRALYHLPSTIPKSSASASNQVIIHTYNTPSPYFILPGAGIDYHPPSASVAHTRTLIFLKKHIGGPFFDIEAVWEEHTHFEFGLRSLAKTMSTMVAEPYVNHVPTMTGGRGRAALTAFYRDHFIFSNPTDTHLELVSRTVGADRVIDEFIFRLTHDRKVDWFLPGVPPTGKTLAVPFVSVVNVRGDRIYHEHIWWDQATALMQAGILPTTIPYTSTPGATLRLPVAGEATAHMLVGHGEPNEMLGPPYGISEQVQEDGAFSDVTSIGAST